MKDGAMESWIRSLFEIPEMLLMGHAQSREDLNLGLGWVYYGLARALRPRTVVVIGSCRGFVPCVLAKALQDNGPDGHLHFVDPSLVDGFWTDPEKVRAHFAAFGLWNVEHHLATTQKFVESPAFAGIQQVDLLFVDGYHSEEQARFDHSVFLPKLGESASVLFHDTRHNRVSRMYGPDRIYQHSVKRYMEYLRQDPAFEVLNLPVDDGVTLVRRRSAVSTPDTPGGVGP